MLGATVQNDDDQQRDFPIIMDTAGQETGVTDATGSGFRRVGDNTFDPSQSYAMVPTHREIFPNPSPEHRKRTPGAPAFIKPSSGDSYLPGLLTILQAVPRAREALLVREQTLAEYGYSADWWKGRPISEPSHILVDGDDDNDGDRALDTGVVHEAQRLMAFLELTERAYGNAEVLGPELATVPPQKQALRFLEVWRETVEALQPGYALADVFTTRHALESGDDGPAITPLVMVDLPLQETLESLYDVMDRALWNTVEDSDPTWLEFGDVFVIRMEAPDTRGGRGGAVVDVDVPLDFYVDRYEKESIELAKKARVELAKYETKAQRITEEQNRLKHVQKPAASACTIEAQQLLEVIRPYLTQPDGDDTASNTSASNAAPLTNGNSAEHAELLDIAKELEVVAERVMAKYQALEDAKEQARAQASALSSFYMEPSAEPEQAPHHRFALRGLVGDPAATYVFANARAPDDLLGAAAADWGWWRLAYAAGETPPHDAREVTDEFVRAQARGKYACVLLLYARCDADDETAQERPLPDSLRNFVWADNLAFAGELDGLASICASPGAKRKAGDEYDDDDAAEPNWGGHRESPPRRLFGAVEPTGDSRRDDDGDSSDTDDGKLVNNDAAPIPPQPTAPPPAPPLYYHRKPVPPTPPPRPPPRRAAPRPPIMIAADIFHNVDLLSGGSDSAAPGGGRSKMTEQPGQASEMLGGTGAGAGEAKGPYASDIGMPDLVEVEDKDLWSAARKV